MALTRTQKESQVTALTEKMKNASSVIFTHYLGLTVSDITKLRAHLRQEEAEMQVAKKSLIQLAAKNANAPEIADSVIPGGVACIFSYKEPTAGASVTHKFGKDHPQIKLVGGIFSGKVLTSAEASEMATIPSKIQLIGMFMAMCNTPLTQFASAIGSPLTGFARALSEIAKKKELSAPAPAAPEVSAVATPAALPEVSPPVVDTPPPAAEEPSAPAAA